MLLPIAFIERLGCGLNSSGKSGACGIGPGSSPRSLDRYRCKSLRGESDPLLSEFDPSCWTCPPRRDRSNANLLFLRSGRPGVAGSSRGLEHLRSISSFGVSIDGTSGKTPLNSCRYRFANDLLAPRDFFGASGVLTRRFAGGVKIPSSSLPSGDLVGNIGLLSCSIRCFVGEGDANGLVFRPRTDPFTSRHAVTLLGGGRIANGNLQFFFYKMKIKCFCTFLSEYATNYFLFAVFLYVFLKIHFENSGLSELCRGGGG